MGVSSLKAMHDVLCRDRHAATTPMAATVNTDSLHIKLIEFEEDRKRMRSQFNARADRTDHKRNVLIPKYKPLAETYLAAGEKYENPIFSTLIVWLFDIGDLSTAIDWCLKAIELELPTPEFIRRDWPTFCADSVLKWAETQAEHGHSVEPYFSRVFAKIRDDWRLHEEVNAKWYKFAGYFLLRDDEGKPRPSAIADKATLEQAKAFLQQANEYHSKIGVGTMISKIDMRLSALETGKNL